MSHIIATIDKEFYQMESANTAQLSKEFLLITHTIANHMFAMKDKDWIHQDNARNVHHIKSAEVSIAQNQNVITIIT